MPSKKKKEVEEEKVERKKNTIQNLTIAAEQNIIDNNRFLYKRNLNSLYTYNHQSTQ